MVADVFDIVGSVIHGAYRVEAVVAEGGFAVVYRAQHQGFNAPVALKCLKLPEKLDGQRQEVFLQQFRAEGELLFELSAALPTVVRPLAIDALTTKDGTFVPYMVLEWLEGETLDVIVARRAEQKRAPLPIKKLVRLLGPIADALAKAHNFSGRSGQVSIVHSDIKPENIFIANVAGDEVVKILDFGVAKAQSVANQVAGRRGSKGAVTSFTPAFAATEQWKPEQYGEVGPWTDVWGLALTMVEALAGRPVIEGDPAAMMGAAFDPIARPTPQEHGVDIGDAVEAVFARALSIDPRERQRDVGVFWSELTSALGMKPERSGDTRREAGVVPREEVVEAALPPGARRAPPRPAARAGVATQVAPPRGPTRATLGVDNPFEDAEDDLDSGLDSVPPGLEASLPSVPPGGDFGGEAPLPSVPAPPRFGGEAPLPSVPPVRPAPGRHTVQQTAAAASNLFELDSMPPPPGSGAAAPALDDPLASVAAEDPFGDLDAPLSPRAPARQSPPPPPEPAEAPAPAPVSAYGYEAPLPSMPRAAPNPRGLELDVGEGRDRPAIREAGRPLARHVPPSLSFDEESAPAPQPWLKIGLMLVAAGMVVGGAGRLYQANTGQTLGVGPVTSTLVAGLALAVGIGFIVYRLLPRDR